MLTLNLLTRAEDIRRTKRVAHRLLEEVPNHSSRDGGIGDTPMPRDNPEP